MSEEQHVVRSINPTPFINRANVKKFLLEHTARTRAHKYTRVSMDTMIEANEVIRRWAVSKVAALPSKGKTI